MIFWENKYSKCHATTCISLSDVATSEVGWHRSICADLSKRDIFSVPLLYLRKPSWVCSFGCTSPPRPTVMRCVKTKPRQPEDNVTCLRAKRIFFGIRRRTKKQTNGIVSIFFPAEVHTIRNRSCAIQPQRNGKRTNAMFRHRTKFMTF